MKLYKYRSLSKLEYALDIIINQRLYCSTYEKLNDPFEGLFHTILSPTNLFALAYAAGVVIDNRKLIRIKEKFDAETQNKNLICSLSSSLTEVLMWSHYADGNKGMVIEIDTTGIPSHDLQEVEYSQKLPSFGDTLLTDVYDIRQVLTKKIINWRYEQEWRLFSTSRYYPIANRITAIYLGTLVESSILEILNKVAPISIPIFKTRINDREIKIQKGEQLVRNPSIKNKGIVGHVTQL